MYPVQKVECFQKRQCVNTLICINDQPEVVYIQCTCAFPERNDGNNRKLQRTATNREIDRIYILFQCMCRVNATYCTRLELKGEVLSEGKKIVQSPFHFFFYC